MQLSLNNFFKIFLIFSAIIFVESFMHYYSHLFVYVFNYTGTLNYYGLSSGYNKLIWNENGLIELLQALFLIVSIYYFIRFLTTSNFKNKEKIFCLFYLIGITYYFLEEISYGQHFFNWSSPEFFININNQKETNFHNISNFLDQLPRAFLSLWIVLPLLVNNSLKKYNNFFIRFILPTKKLKIISVYFLIFFLPNFVTKKLNFFPDYSGHEQAIRVIDVYDFFTFNFIKLSEYCELIFCIFILTHSINLYKNNKI